MFADSPLPIYHPLTPILCDVISLHLVEGFHWNLPQTFSM